jgi:hypothetical protein
MSITLSATTPTSGSANVTLASATGLSANTTYSIYSATNIPRTSVLSTWTVGSGWTNVTTNKYSHSSGTTATLINTFWLFSSVSNFRSRFRRD